MSDTNGNGSVLKVGAMRLAEMGLLAGVLYGTLSTQIEQNQTVIGEVKTEIVERIVPELRAMAKQVGEMSLLREAIRRNEEELFHRRAAISAIPLLQERMQNLSRQLEAVLNRDGRAPR